MTHYRRTLLGRLDQRFLRGRWVRLILAGLLAAVLVVPSGQFVTRICEVEKSDYRGEKYRTALGRWMADAQALTRLDEGEDPYGWGHWFPTPPLVLICLVPFAKMGCTTAGSVWAGLKVVGFVGAMWLLIRSLSPRGYAVPVGVLMVTAAFGIRPVVSDLQHGNLNIFVMIWLGLAWVLYIRGRDGWSGIFVALGVVTKITPTLVLVYFAYKHAWRVVAGVALGMVLFFVALPGLYLGFGQNFRLLHNWYEMMIEPFAVRGYAMTTIENQSLYGVSLRLLSSAGIVATEELPTSSAMQIGAKPEHMARPVTRLGRLVQPGISLAVVAALAWLCRRGAPPDRRQVRLWLEFSLVLLAMHLLSERTWKHHLTTLPIVYLVVWYVLTCQPWSDRFRAWFVAGLAMQFLLLTGSSEGLFARRISDLLLDWGVYCWGLLLCAIQVGVMIKAMDKRRAAADSEA